mmetsp:Transcript_21974/g.36808  ORF Transcript_21974/g.36808 Transcript_21974/m.36808 type:complete len:277 (+) Transcript_21974:104-934(+)
MIWLGVAVAVIFLFYIAFGKPARENADSDTTVNADTEVSTSSAQKRKKLSNNDMLLMNRLRLSIDEILYRPISISVEKTALLNGDVCYLDDLRRIVSALEAIAAVTLILLVEDDTEEQDIIQNLGMLLPTLASHRYLFCATMVGKTAMVRQMDPLLHLEHDRSFANKMKPHLRSIIMYEPPSSHFSLNSGKERIVSRGVNSTDDIRNARVGLSSSFQPTSPAAETTKLRDPTVADNINMKKRIDPTRIDAGSIPWVDGLPTVDFLGDIIELSLLPA